MTILLHHGNINKMKTKESQVTTLKWYSNTFPRFYLTLFQISTIYDPSIIFFMTVYSKEKIISIENYLGEDKLTNNLITFIDVNMSFNILKQLGEYTFDEILAYGYTIQQKIKEEKNDSYPNNTMVQ